MIPQSAVLFKMTSKRGGSLTIVREGFAGAKTLKLGRFSKGRFLLRISFKAQRNILPVENI